MCPKQLVTAVAAVPVADVTVTVNVTVRFCEILNDPEPDCHLACVYDRNRKPVFESSHARETTSVRGQKI